MAREDWLRGNEFEGSDLGDPPSVKLLSPVMEVKSRVAMDCLKSAIISMYLPSWRVTEFHGSRSLGADRWALWCAMPSRVGLVSDSMGLSRDEDTTKGV